MELLLYLVQSLLNLAQSVVDVAGLVLPHTQVSNIFCELCEIGRHRQSLAVLVDELPALFGQSVVPERRLAVKRGLCRLTLDDKTGAFGVESLPNSPLQTRFLLDADRVDSVTKLCLPVQKKVHQ